MSQTEIRHDDPGYSPEVGRGNPTATSVWRNTDGAWIETRAKYDAYGNVIETTDARGAVTRIDYDQTH